MDDDVFVLTVEFEQVVDPFPVDAPVEETPDVLQETVEALPQESSGVDFSEAAIMADPEMIAFYAQSALLQRWVADPSYENMIAIYAEQHPIDSL